MNRTQIKLIRVEPGGNCTRSQTYLSLKSTLPGASQKLTRIQNRATNGIPTVVPGPKKSPKAPAGILKSFILRIGLVFVQSAFKQRSVALPSWLAGTGNAPKSEMKLFPGFVLLK